MFETSCYVVKNAAWGQISMFVTLIRPIFGVIMIFYADDVFHIQNTMQPDTFALKLLQLQIIHEELLLWLKKKIFLLVSFTKLAFRTNNVVKGTCNKPVKQ